MKTPQSIIQQEFIGGRYNGIENTINELTQICKSEIIFVDDKVHDGVDDDETEDTQVRVAHFKCMELMMDIYFYYYNISLEINFISIITNK